MDSLPSPKKLDAQALIRVDRWLDVHSSECRELDTNHWLTLKFIKLGFEEPAYLAVDLDGRIWGKGVNGIYYPFHFTYFGKNIGYRLAKKAAN